jgi:putative endopeptidase
MAGRNGGTRGSTLTRLARIFTSTVAEPSPEPTYIAGIDVTAIDKTVAPGNDFYEYANRGWLQRAKIPSGWVALDSLAVEHNSNTKSLIRIVQQCAREVRAGYARAGTARHLVGTLFIDAFNERKFGVPGVESLRPELDKIWEISTHQQLAEALAHLHKLRIGAMFGIQAARDRKNSSSRIAELNLDGISGLDNTAYYLQEDNHCLQMRSRYIEHLGVLFRRAGDSAENASRNAEAAFCVEKELAQVLENSSTLEERRLADNKVDLVELTRLAPSFDWSVYFKTVGLTEEQVAQINLQAPKFVEGMSKLAASIKLDDLKAYLRSCLLRNTAIWLDERFAREHHRFYQQTLRGNTGSEAFSVGELRFAEILGSPYRIGLEGAFGQLYAEEMIPEGAKKRVERMINDAKTAFGEAIQNSDWMSPAAKAAARKKIERMRIRIGYPEKWRDYSALRIDGLPFVRKILAASAFDTKHELEKIGRPVNDLTEWPKALSPWAANATTYISRK